MQICVYALTDSPNPCIIERKAVKRREMIMEEKDEKREVPKNAFDFSSFKPTAGPTPVVVAEAPKTVMPPDYVPKNAFDFGSSRPAEKNEEEAEKKSEQPAEAKAEEKPEEKAAESKENDEPLKETVQSAAEDDDDEVVVIGETIESGDEEDEVVF